ncbi:hypothetical protein VTK26DRAFT_5764 [Humicola hyalothermophila]
MFVPIGGSPCPELKGRYQTLTAASQEQCGLHFSTESIQLSRLVPQVFKVASMRCEMCNTASRCRLSSHTTNFHIPSVWTHCRNREQVPTFPTMASSPLGIPWQLQSSIYNSYCVIHGRLPARIPHLYPSKRHWSPMEGLARCLKLALVLEIRTRRSRNHESIVVFWDTFTHSFSLLTSKQGPCAYPRGIVWSSFSFLPFRLRSIPPTCPFLPLSSPE